MPRQHARVITPFNRDRHINYSQALAMLDAGEAELVYEVPLTIRIIDKTEYQEELRYQRGRRIEVTKGPSPDDRYPNQDWEGEFELPERPTTGRKSIRAKPPRHRIDERERDFQRYKTGWLRRKGEEELERAKRRSGG